MIFPQRNGSTVPTTAPTTETSVNTALPAGHDDPSSPFFTPPDARAGYYTDPEEELIAYGEEMSRPQLMGWLPGPLLIARQRTYDATYPAVREWSIAHGDHESRWPAPDQTTPDERRQAMRHARSSAPTPNDQAMPTVPDAESIAIWQHHRRVARAQAAAAKVQAQLNERLAYDRDHRCGQCGEVEPSTTTRTVMLIPLRCCAACEVLLNAGMVSILSRQRLADGRTRGQAMSEWLAANAGRWDGVQFPPAMSRRIGDRVQGRGLPQPPPAVQSGPPLPTT